MTRKRIELTPDEMLRIREGECLSNRELAEKLNISYATVLKMIGPQTTPTPRYSKMDFISGERSLSARLGKSEDSPAPMLLPAANVKYESSLVSCIFGIKTENNTYSVDAKDGMVTIQSNSESGNAVTIVIKQGELSKLAEELKEVNKAIASKMLGFASIVFNS